MASLPIHSGHEATAFVQPSSFLKRTRGLSHPPAPSPAPMPHGEEKGTENAVDRDQRVGLVSLPPDNRHPKIERILDLWIKSQSY